MHNTLLDNISEALHLLPLSEWDRFFEYRKSLILKSIGNLSTEKLIEVQTKINCLEEIKVAFQLLYNNKQKE